MIPFILVSVFAFLMVPSVTEAGALDTFGENCKATEEYIVVSIE